jgi:hypothetical protein
MFECKPDYERVLERFEAWWQGDIVDRTPVSIVLDKPVGERIPVPQKEHTSLRERWFDSAFQAEAALARCSNAIYLGEALPVAYPNLGPEVFSAFYGCDLEFSNDTSWSVPNLGGWAPEDLESLQLQLEGNTYYDKIMELTDAFIEVARGRFIVGYPDLHPGGDAIAAFRDPQELCMDVLLHGDSIKALVQRVTADFFTVYDRFHEKLSAAGMPSTTWIPVVGEGKFHIPSNDFSCMISDAMFEDLFLPGLMEECRYTDRNIYHLDGPDALRYLEMLMEIPNLHAIQWVPGAGRAAWPQAIDVYRRIQARGKSLTTVDIPAGDLDEFMSHLRPEGVWLNVSGVSSPDEAESVLNKVSKWGTH